MKGKIKLPFQGVIDFGIIQPKAMPWARIIWAFSPKKRSKTIVND